METTLKRKSDFHCLPFEEEKRRSLVWAIGISGFLSVFKGSAGLISSSAALVASALDSLMDVGISSVNYLAVGKGVRPPDQDHAYGHEKIESLASYTEGIVILFGALLLVTGSLRQAWGGRILFHSGLALAVIAGAVIVNLALVTILKRAERRTASLILKAELAHYSTDALSYFAIFLVLILVRWTGWAGWDRAGGILTASYVAFLAVRILLRAGSELMDHSLPRTALDRLDGLIQTHDPRVLGYHKLRTRRVGPKTFIDLHLVMEPHQSFEEAHGITESLIRKIKTRFTHADVTIHEDPKGGR